MKCPNFAKNLRFFSSISHQICWLLQNHLVPLMCFPPGSSRRTWFLPDTKRRTEIWRPNEWPQFLYKKYFGHCVVPVPFWLIGKVNVGDECSPVPATLAIGSSSASCSLLKPKPTVCLFMNQYKFCCGKGYNLCSENLFNFLYYTLNLKEIFFWCKCNLVAHSGSALSRTIIQSVS